MHTRIQGDGAAGGAHGGAAGQAGEQADGESPVTQSCDLASRLLLTQQGKVKEKRLQQLAAALVQEEAAVAAKVEERKKRGKKGEEEDDAKPAVARVTVGELRCVRMRLAC